MKLKISQELKEPTKVDFIFLQMYILDYILNMTPGFHKQANSRVFSFYFWAK